jgi:putative FmdB family regulatory protein
MPTYDFICPHCGWQSEKNVPIMARATQRCPQCSSTLTQQILKAPLGKMKGAVVQGGGPDRFTADVLGIPLKDLPEGLRTKPST